MLKQITDKSMVISTVVLKKSDASVLQETMGVFDFEPLSQEDHVVLFTISIEDAGMIVMDLFQRGPGSRAQISNVTTITEKGSSLLAG